LSFTLSLVYADCHNNAERHYAVIMLSVFVLNVVIP
jgi:hypothetical protein